MPRRDKERMIAEVTVVLPLPELAAPIKKHDKLDILFDDFLSY